MLPPAHSLHMWLWTTITLPTHQHTHLLQLFGTSFGCSMPPPPVGVCTVSLPRPLQPAPYPQARVLVCRSLAPIQAMVSPENHQCSSTCPGVALAAAEKGVMSSAVKAPGFGLFFLLSWQMENFPTKQATMYMHIIAEHERANLVSQLVQIFSICRVVAPPYNIPPVPFL